MTTRILTQDEWSKLVDVQLPEVGNAANSGVVIAVENEAGEVIGSCAVFQCVHVEALWIHPAHRGKAAVARRLVKATRAAVKSLNASAALTTVLPRSQTAAMWSRRGATEVLGKHLMVSMI